LPEPHEEPPLSGRLLAPPPAPQSPPPFIPVPVFSLPPGQVYWYTVEFGVVREAGGIKAFGAGVLSSYGELEWMASGGAELSPFDPYAKQPKMRWAQGGEGVSREGGCQRKPRLLPFARPAAAGRGAARRPPPRLEPARPPPDHSPAPPH
jgi:hypothetical protein